jgi:hypothetical protein
MGNSLSELEQPPPQTHQQHSQSQPQQHQPNEPTKKEELRLPSRRENNLLLSPQHNSESSRKTGQNGTVTQSAAKPLIKQQSFPHNYDHILKDADSTVDKSSREKLCDQLYAGVFLHHKTKASSIYSLSKTTTSL